MTTTDQLAAALKNCKTTLEIAHHRSGVVQGLNGITEVLAAADAALAAYNSAQKAEGAGGGVREQFCNWFAQQSFLSEPEWHAWQAAFEHGRQQGMSQERALWELSQHHQFEEPAASSAQEPALPQCHVADIGFRWDGERRHHIPSLLIEFEPVPMNAPANSKGWVDRDAMAAILAAHARLAGATNKHARNAFIGHLAAELHKRFPGVVTAEFTQAMLDVAPDGLAGATQGEAEPIDMVLHCPTCGLQHIDAPEDLPMAIPGGMFDGSAGWVNPPHRSHLCHGCGHIWRPADVPTNGVAAVKTTGKADSPIAHPQAPAATQPDIDKETT